VGAHAEALERRRQPHSKISMLKPSPNINNHKIASLLRFFLSRQQMVLRNMVTKDELDDEFIPEVTEECSKFGEVKNIKIHTPEVRFFFLLLFSSNNSLKSFVL